MYIMSIDGIGVKIWVSSDVPKRAQALRRKYKAQVTIERVFELMDRPFHVEKRTHEVLQLCAVGNEVFCVDVEVAICAVSVAVRDVNQGWKWPLMKCQSAGGLTLASQHEKGKGHEPYFFTQPKGQVLRG